MFSGVAMSQEDMELWNREPGVGGHIGGEFVAEVEDHSRAPGFNVGKAYLRR